MTTQYTRNFRLALPDFRSGPWHDLVNNDFISIDELLMSVFQGVDTRPWVNNYLFKAGMTAIDTTDNTFWVCILDHTSAPVPTTFAQDRAAHPTYWNRIVVGVSPRGDWHTSTHYLINDIVVDSVEGIIAVCNQEHTSSPPPATIRTDAAYWNFLTDFHGTSIEAIYVKYNNVASGVSAVNVQAALDYAFATDKTQNTNIAANTTAISALDTRVTHTEQVNIDQDNRLNTGFVAINTLDARIDVLEAGGPSTHAIDVSYANFMGEPFSNLQDGTSYLYQKDKTQDSTIGTLDARVALLEAGGGAGGGNPVYVGDTPPVSPPDRAMWFESDTGLTYFRYNDGNSSQWVAIGGGGGVEPASALPLMDGVAVAGVMDKYSRGDHVHPTDSSISLKVAKAGDTMTGTLGIMNANPAVALTATGGGASDIIGLQSPNKYRWIMRLGDATPETGSNTGSNFALWGYNDAANQLTCSININRASGTVALSNALNVGTTLSVAGDTALGAQLRVSADLTLRKDVAKGGVVYFGNDATRQIMYDGNNFQIVGAPLYLPQSNQPLITGGPVYVGYTNAASGGYYFGNNGVNHLDCDGTNFKFYGSAGIYAMSAPGTPGFGGSVATGFYTDATNIAIRAIGSASIYFQSQSGGANYAIFANQSTTFYGNVAISGGGLTSGGLQTNGNSVVTGNETISGTLTTSNATFNANGSILFNGNAGTIAGAAGTNVMFQGAGGGYEAYMTFHRPGAFACNFGLGTDANFWMGGWSFGGGVAYRFWTTRDFTGVPTTNGVTGIRLAMAADYAHTAVGVTEPYGGAVVTGGSPIVSGSYYYSRYRWLQALVNGGWGTVGLA
jgi:hypothetical protein